MGLEIGDWGLAPLMKVSFYSGFPPLKETLCSEHTPLSSLLFIPEFLQHHHSIRISRIQFQGFLVIADGQF